MASIAPGSFKKSFKHRKLLLHLRRDRRLRITAQEAGKDEIAAICPDDPAKFSVGIVIFYKFPLRRILGGGCRRVQFDFHRVRRLDPFSKNKTRAAGGR